MACLQSLRNLACTDLQSHSDTCCHRGRNTRRRPVVGFLVWELGFAGFASTPPHPSPPAAQRREGTSREMSCRRAHHLRLPRQSSVPRLAPRRRSEVPERPEGSTPSLCVRAGVASLVGTTSRQSFGEGMGEITSGPPAPASSALGADSSSGCTVGRVSTRRHRRGGRLKRLFRRLMFKCGVGHGTVESLFGLHECRNGRAH